MFSPPTGVSGPKNGAASSLEHRNVQGPHYKTGMIEEGRSSWSSSSQPSPSYDSRGYEGSSYNDHMNDRGMLNNNMSNPYDMNSNSSSMSSFMGKPMDKSYPMPYSSMSREPTMPPNQPGMSSLGSEMPLSSPNSLSPHNKRGSPYPYGGYNSANARRPIVPESSRLPGGPSAKRSRGLSAVESPSGSYDPYNQDSPRYTSPKPPGMYSDFMDGSHGSPDTWHSNGMPPSTSGYSSAMLSSNTTSSYGNMHQPPHDPMGYGHPMSPSSHEALSMHQSLPPMSTFSGNPNRGSAPYPSNTSPLNASESIMGGRSSTGPTPGGAAASGASGGGSQTGDALGKALASIYQPDHTSSSFPSNPSTPVGSPAPMSGAQWPRPSSQTSPGPYGESHLHSLYNEPVSKPIHVQSHTGRQHRFTATNKQSRMEERLDDAINVLRTHAMSADGSMLQGLPSSNLNNIGMGGNVLGHHPTHANNGMDSHMGHGTPFGHGQYDAMVQSHMPGPPTHGHQPMAEDGTVRLRNSVPVGPTTTPEIAQPQQPFNAVHNEILSQNGNQAQGIKIEKIDQKKKKNSNNNQESNKRNEDLDDKLSIADDDGTDSERQGQSSASARSKKSRPTEDEPPEVKVVREKERRHANNARERIRVRDINEAFKELGRMCSIHLKSDKAQTKLCILHQAVNVITSLEQQVRERNLNPKAACLKRREEEKVDELPNRSSGPSIAEQALGSSGARSGRRAKRTEPGMSPLEHERFPGIDIFGSQMDPADNKQLQQSHNLHVDAATISPTVSSTSTHQQPPSPPVSSTVPLTHALPTDPFQTSPHDHSLTITEGSSVNLQ
ncbi:transcription factor 12-like isoform X5 [Ptychodera flava]